MPEEKCILNPERDCIGKAAAVKLEARIDALEAWQRDSKKFHNDFYDWQRTQIARDARLDEQLGNMEKILPNWYLNKKSKRKNPVSVGTLLLTKSFGPS